MTTYRAPDVYVEEKPTFPASVAEVSTAIPVFIGYTQRAATANGDSLTLKPTKLYSIKEFETYFGFQHVPDIHVDVDVDTEGLTPSAATVASTELAYLLYYAVKMYFNNGGGQCYVVSVGNYKDTIAGAALLDGLKATALEDEPTLLVIPEATKLSSAEYADVTQAMIEQCGKLGDRFAILDLLKGDQDSTPKNDESSEPIIPLNRGAWTGELKYAAAYYPFLKTTMSPVVNEDERNVKVALKKPTDKEPGLPAELVSLKEERTAIYNFVKLKLREVFLVMPPSGAVAGVYAATDAARGVWKAPANVALNGVIEPVVRLNAAMQDDLNVDVTAGKSINAIRAFAGKGTLVWGARTLAGNDNEWRYVPVRRFFSVVEESIKKSTYWAVFESNDANTWVKVRGMIENYLTDKWRDGALAGARPGEAFYVKCGLGTTMSAVDIQEGRMNVEVGLAVVRPAEFIVLKFSHKLQTS